MDIPEMTEAPTSQVDYFELKTENLAGTLKWLVASAGSIAVAVIAGLQLTSLQDLRLWAALIAILGAVLALSAVGLVLFGAARVLALNAPTIIDLSNRELDLGLLQANRLGSVEKIGAEAPMLKWVYERRTQLLGESRSITELYTDEFVGSGLALAALERKEPYALAGRNLRPEEPSDVAWVKTKRTQAKEYIQQIEAAVAYQQRLEAYQRLVKQIQGLAIWFVAGIIVFALTPVVGFAPKSTEFTQPVPARIHVLEAQVAGVPQGCPATLKGQIVGGSLQSPIVVTEPVGTCPALRLTDHPEAIIVVPETIP